MWGQVPDPRNPGDGRRNRGVSFSASRSRAPIPMVHPHEPRTAPLTDASNATRVRLPIHFPPRAVSPSAPRMQGTRGRPTETWSGTPLPLRAAPLPFHSRESPPPLFAPRHYGRRHSDVHRYPAAGFYRKVPPFVDLLANATLDAFTYRHDPDRVQNCSVAARRRTFGVGSCTDGVADSCSAR